MLFSAVAFILLGLLIGFSLFWIISLIRKNNAVYYSSKVKNDALKESEHILKDARITAKSEVLKLKEAFEDECRNRRKELSKIEQRLESKEESLDKKLDALEGRYDSIEKKEKELIKTKEKLDAKELELQQKINLQIEELQRISEMSKDAAKKVLLEKLEYELKQEMGQMIRDSQERAKETAETEAHRIIISAIQRYASECTYERTTATIPISNDEMKGRIIGRDGRNIRALEAATGVNILIDDTPEAVVISCFDPVRKEIGRQVLERLISDGRIHPTRVEEVTKKIRKDVEKDIMDVGGQAALEVGIQGISPQIIKLIGRLKYRYSFSQNVLKHSLETAYFMGMIAAELGLDQQKARRIGLLHDIGKAVDHEVEGTHAAIGADILRKNNEDPIVINAVASHHDEVEPTSVYAILANACDALSASRPGARSETTELYLKRLEHLEAIANSYPGVESSYALQAGREIRVVVEPEKITDEKAQSLARDICLRVEKEVTYPGKIQVTVIRETRSVDYAK
ncbi:MAG TPA: ribonuclease Y [Lentisphaeria bacterium]|nr:MAG: ribonuclease Y [Lentisphaerae bacterium GWF2_38_69]HBM16164.1 ribonuclease Y [Lentisphaeria bacterium]